MFLYSRKTTPGSSKHKQWIVKAKGAKANKIFIEESCCWRIYYRNGRETLLSRQSHYLYFWDYDSVFGQMWILWVAHYLIEIAHRVTCFILYNDFVSRAWNSQPSNILHQRIQIWWLLLGWNSKSRYYRKVSSLKYATFHLQTW